MGAFLHTQNIEWKELRKFDDWRDKCDFDFYESGLQGGETTGA
jgi:hypothetical protein